jgi:riboflavin biosynthesis pyrimidine reductase
MSGRPADRFGQFELRAHVDAFLIGAATLRADRAVGAPGEPELVARRKEELGNAAPLNVFFSVSGNFPSDAAVFRDPEIETLLVVPRRAAEREPELRTVADDVWVVSDERPLSETWERLRGRDVETIGFEGGPKLMGLALQERLVHELLLTHSPLLLGGSGGGFAAIEEPLHGIRTEPLFLGLDETANLLFERSLVVYD